MRKEKKNHNQNISRRHDWANKLTDEFGWWRRIEKWTGEIPKANGNKWDCPTHATWWWWQNTTINSIRNKIIITNWDYLWRCNGYIIIVYSSDRRCVSAVEQWGEEVYGEGRRHVLGRPAGFAASMSVYNMWQCEIVPSLLLWVNTQSWHCITTQCHDNGVKLCIQYNLW